MGNSLLYKFLILGIIPLLLIIPGTAFADETELIVKVNPDVSDGGEFSKYDGNGSILGIVVEGELKDQGHILVTTKGIFKNSNTEIEREERVKLDLGNQKHLFVLDYPFAYDVIYQTTVTHGDIIKVVKWIPLSSTGEQVEISQGLKQISQVKYESPPNTVELYNHTDEIVSLVLYFEKESQQSGKITLEGKYVQLPETGNSRFDIQPSYSDPLRYNIPIRIDHNYDDEKFNVGVTEEGYFDWSKTLKAEADKDFEFTLFYKTKWKQVVEPFKISELEFPKSIPEKENLKQTKIPDWVKNNAKWWADGQVDDSTFTQGIGFLIKEKIIGIDSLPEQASEVAEQQVPDWIRNNAGWWADGMISEGDFIKGITFLVEKRIIQVN
ncbi:hypothetical protein SCCGRSA3_01057 [Marine Group I thaumarchaeote SCGC RSA3]|uniref:Blue copper domain-containing protein n=3 Tax=Marine Group I TaxID=905826 RepID=A0A081RMG0_9ARCH|nr:hypothetical protein AAA799N04_01150 [Marine Group I thaumarchaeote SCGC AAA799-N04]KFM16667.1 hypothetical protein AAA799D11_00615 [Marine Group I thaumarchaeote SCGC AAA799-D11]KFM18719.1 hypothetical protein SCCGRSA3_01057 [Marine Group I thaumarchaeote SCGC RSA3]